MYNRHEHINPNNRNNCFNNNYLHRYQTSRRKRRYKNSFIRCSNWLGSIWSNPHVYKWFIGCSYRRNRMVLCFEMALQLGLVKNNRSCSNTLDCRVNSWSNFANWNGPILKRQPPNLFTDQKFFFIFLFIYANNILIKSPLKVKHHNQNQIHHYEL